MQQKTEILFARCLCNSVHVCRACVSVCATADASPAVVREREREGPCPRADVSACRPGVLSVTRQLGAFWTREVLNRA